MSAHPGLRSVAAERFAANSAVEVRRGLPAVLASADLLAAFAERCRQTGAASDLAYFLTKPGFLKRVPLLLLFRNETASAETELETGHLQGALLLYEYRLSGVRTGIYTSNDRSGRSTLIAPAALRGSIAWSAARYLLQRKARLVMFSFRDETGGSGEPADPSPAPPGLDGMWAMRRREIPEFLPLASSYDKTLSTIGQRTRSNLRYYRRRTERELGCTFLPQLEFDHADLLAFNRVCMYAVSDQIAGWRLSTMQTLQEPILMGIKDRDGRLLSVLGGRRVGTGSEILWQMNREGFRHLSLSLVMRGYFIEHEIGRGARRFYIEGGTPHPIRESFTTAEVSDLAVLRRSPTAALIRKLARRAFEEENALATMLFDPSLEWHGGDPTVRRTPGRSRVSSLSAPDVK